jgi:hypothetical protein
MVPAAMPEPHPKSHDEPHRGLIAALFCAIVGLIVYAGLVY